MSRKSDADKNTSLSRFRAALDLQVRSGVGVIMVRSREPFRTRIGVRELAMSYAVPCRCWDMADGWKNYDATGKEGQSAQILDPGQALRGLLEAGKKDEEQFDGYSVMDNIHVMLGYHPGQPILESAVQLLRKYAHEFSTMAQRLILIVPETFSMPPALQHDVPVIDFELPEFDEIHESVSALLTDMFGSKVPDMSKAFSNSAEESAACVVGLSRSASGLTNLEVEAAVSKAILVHGEAQPGKKLRFDALNRAVLEDKTQAVKRSEVLELVPVGNMSQVGGLGGLKAWVGERRDCFSDEARAYGVDTPKGIAMIGVPGSGKSLASRAIAHELNMPLIRFDVSSVFGSLVGQSEARVRQALKQLRAMAPCVAWIDEVDKAGLDPRGASGDSGVGKRVMGNILTFMQENELPIFWVFTANRVDGLPPEMLRKGRLDEVFSVLLPTPKERREVLRIHLAKRHRKPEEIEDLEVAVTGSEGYVAAELEAAVKEAVITSWHNKVPVTGALIHDQLRHMRPISLAYPEDFQKMTDWAANNARPASLPDNETPAVLPSNNGAPRRRNVTAKGPGAGAN